MLHTSITNFTRQISQHAGRGLHFWVSGHTQTTDSFARLKAKFRDEYWTEATHGQRSARQARGAANAHLMAIAEDEGRVFWILLISAGNHPAKETITKDGNQRPREPLKDANRPDQRITYRDYELIHATRANISGGGSSWTWFFTRDIEQGIARALSKVCEKGNPSDVSKHVVMLSNYVMHRGVRGQLQKAIRRGQTLFAKHGQGREWPTLQPNELPKMGSFKKAKPLDTTTG